MNKEKFTELLEEIACLSRAIELDESNIPPESIALRMARMISRLCGEALEQLSE